MDSAALTVLRGRLVAAIAGIDAALEALGRVCFDCHRPARAMTQCSDGEWRGPHCRDVYEAGAGVQLPIEGAR